MSRILLPIVFVVSLYSFGQTTEKYNSDYNPFFQAEDLFEKEQFAAARKEYRLFIDEFDQPNDPLQIKARYYEALSALELYNNDAVSLLEAFNKDYPESIYKQSIYFKLGKYYYYKKKYEDALVWFNKLSAKDIDPKDVEEFYFKIGYSYFKEEKYELARDAFYEVKDGVTQYAQPARYYYSHIAYQNEQYQTALDGFLSLEKDENYRKVVGYYIAQIYYLQGKYDKVTEYATKIQADGKIVDERNLNHLIGDAFYRTERYDEAVPYLEKYNRSSKTTRDEDYRLGYAYYRSNHCDKAIQLFDRVKKEKDSLGQVAYYHIGECLLKQNNKVSARSAFEEAAFIDADLTIQEDALYNYAILSYQLDINPYDEAVEAFELYLDRYPDTERRNDIYQYLVNVYTSTNNYAKALTSLDKLPQKDIRLKTAYQLVAYNQGVERYQKANFTGAISSFNLVDKYPIEPELSAKSIYWKADANYRLHKYKDAISGYKQFISAPSVNDRELKREAQYNIGYAYLKDKQKEKSIEAFRSYIQMNPSYAKKKADAYMRIADGHFVLKHNDQAIENYQNAIDLNSGYVDQALYYMARTYGYKVGMNDKKISKLLEIINNHKDSKYLLKAIYDVAESYKSAQNNSQALKYYQQIVYDYPNSNLVIDARINSADIYAKQGKFDTAEAEYKDILESHGSDQKVCQHVAQGLKDLYQSTNHPEKIEVLAEQYACIELDPEEKENIYYLPAIEIYNNEEIGEPGRFEQAIPKFEKYLSKFPNGRYSNDVKNYLADCHYQLEDIETAITLYRETLEGPVTGFTEKAASRVSHYLYNNDYYEDAIKYYQILEKTSSTPEIVFNSKVGLMRSHFLVENWQNAANYSVKVLKNTQINDELELIANYINGLSNYNAGNYELAKKSLKWVEDNTTTVRAAEAKYTLASLYHKQSQLEKADSEITSLLKMKPAYNFWIAKSLILRARIYMEQDKLFDSEETLKSVLEHYPNDTDGIKDEANELWDELMQLKDQPKDIDPEEESVIEINGQGGN